jgi:DNA-binding LytR/AlgR family response regulator
MSAQPYSVYLAEDEPLARDALLAMFAALPEWRVLGAADNGRQALTDCLARPPDLLLTDVRMPVLDGIALVAGLRPECAHTQVVFVTAYDQHALAAFRLAAVDYLLKPVTDAEFRACIQRVRSALDNQRALQQLNDLGLPLDALLRQRRESMQHLVVRSLGHVDIVPLAEIVAIRADGNYVDVLTADRAYVHRETLKSLLERLDPARFVQVHRSVIVSIRSIRRLSREAGAAQVVLDNGSAFPVGERHLAAVERCLGV